MGSWKRRRKEKVGKEVGVRQDVGEKEGDGGGAGYTRREVG